MMERFSSPVPVCMNENTAPQYWSVSLVKENKSDTLKACGSQLVKYYY
jgi:hypothetical protein